MNKYYLRFASKEEAISVLGIETSEDGHLILQKDGVDFDFIGTIYRESGDVMETEQGDINIMEALEGYHVNAISEEPQNFTDYEVTPTNHYRVFMNGR